MGGLLLPDVARLHQRGVQVQIVRHHRGAQDSDGDVQAVAAQARNQPGEHLRGGRLGPENLDAEAAAHDGDERENERLQGANAEALKPEQEQRIGGRQKDARQQWDMEQQVETDGRAQHLGQVAGGDGDFAQAPER